MTQELLSIFIIKWVDQIVFSQLYIVFALGGATVGLMIFRRQREREIFRLKELYAEQFINEMVSQAEGTHEIFLHRPPPYRWMQVNALQETLLAQINSLSGSEKEYAVKRYMDLDFSKDDIELCVSLLWWKRLEGISHLNSLKTDSFGRVFNYMRKDPNQMVALYALLGLSGLSHKYNNPQLFSTLDTYLTGQDNILLEITRNWSNAFGLEQLVNYVDNTSSFEFRNTFVAAICQLKTPESAQVIANFLQQTTRFFPAELVADMIHSLREIGDSSAGTGIRSYLNHENEVVRQRAVEYMIEVEFDIPDNLALQIANDPSPGVRRIYDDWASTKSKVAV